MTAQEWLVLAASLATGAAVALVALAVSRRLARRAGVPAGADLEAMRRLAVRLRRLERLARRTERRLADRGGELRRLLAQADGRTPPAADDSPRPAAPGADAESPDAREEALPHILEKERDLIFRLRLQGLEPVDIARRLSLPVGEIELTLRLHDEQAGTYKRDSEVPRARAEAGS